MTVPQPVELQQAARADRVEGRRKERLQPVQQPLLALCAGGAALAVHGDAGAGVEGGEGVAAQDGGEGVAVDAVGAARLGVHAEGLPERRLRLDVHRRLLEDLRPGPRRSGNLRKR